MNHRRVPVFIPGYDKSYALYSDDAGTKTAVVFVHGFGGSPTGTWRNFHGLIEEYSSEYPWWTTSDLFFFAYDSIKTPIRFNATRLAEFVAEAWEGRWTLEIKPKIKKRSYGNLILAGHSEGGVLIRQLILDRFEAIRRSHAENSGQKVLRALQTDYILRSYLRLFAPACCGTNFSSWIGFLNSYSFLVSAITSSLLVRNELRPGSTVLSTLQRETEDAHVKFPTVRAFYAEPLFGVPDQIVTSQSYRGELIHWEQNSDHFAVCKPKYLYKRPLEFVKT
jgi:pimeloyl-ACP methyl ester carboxylesterase